MLTIGRKTVIYLCLFVNFACSSCYRNSIQFGNAPDNNYSRIVLTDTVQPHLSTVILDSFVTNSPSSFLIGKYKDQYLGIVYPKPFFQMNNPLPAPTIPLNAIYDSLVMIVHLNHYYYGDTTRSLTIQANELAMPIEYPYSSNIYNTTNVPVKPTPLGSSTLKIRPSTDDSFIIKLNDTKGMEIFNKIQQYAVELSTASNFQNYFRGISFSVGTNDTSVAYGVSSAAGKTIMRVYYHLTTPSFQGLYVDFTSLSNTYSFNQIITDRSSTLIYSAIPGVQEFLSGNTNNLAFTQYGAGVLAKVIFPSLKGILQPNNTAVTSLLKAELIVKPQGNSFNNFLKLPSSLQLALTDASNIIGTQIFDSTGATILNVSPIIDNIYGLNTYYRFNITSYVNHLLTTAGTEQSGFFVMEKGSTAQIDRAIFGDFHNIAYQIQLLLTLAIINK